MRSRPSTRTGTMLNRVFSGMHKAKTHKSAKGEDRRSARGRTSSLVECSAERDDQTASTSADVGRAISEPLELSAAGLELSEAGQADKTDAAEPPARLRESIRVGRTSVSAADVFPLLAGEKHSISFSRLGFQPQWSDHKYIIDGTLWLTNFRVVFIQEDSTVSLQLPLPKIRSVKRIVEGKGANVVARVEVKTKNVVRFNLVYTKDPRISEPACFGIEA